MKNIMYSIKYGYAVITVKILDWISVMLAAASAIVVFPAIKLSAKYGISTSYGGAMAAMCKDSNVYREATETYFSPETVEQIQNVEREED